MVAVGGGATAGILVTFGADILFMTHYNLV